MPVVSRQSGAGLVAVLVGIAIVGILMAALTNYLSVAIKVSQELHEKDNLEALRRSFRVKMNCSATIDVITACPAGSPVGLRRTGGDVFVRIPKGNRLSKSGKYYLQARCAGSFTASSAVLRFDVLYSKDQSTWEELFDFPIVCERRLP